VTDVRRLHRVVLSKDQAIQEVHHRVKNNLQTISSLLRLQARRSGDPDSATALLEAERRVRAIAVVHEVLSREPGEEVEFAAIVRALVAMVEDTVIAPPAVEITVTGELGVMGTDVATPFAVVIAELLTNAIEHAFVGFTGADSAQVGSVLLTLARTDDALRAEVRDNGCGVATDFSIDDTTSLGLSIVRDLVRNQLGGSIEVVPVSAKDGAGTRAVVRVPITGEVLGVVL
jgi:two-component sensor histidine kinase